MMQRVEQSEFTLQTFKNYQTILVYLSIYSYNLNWTKILLHNHSDRDCYSTTWFSPQQATNLNLSNFQITDQVKI